ncbi:MAG TPA: polysaccharide biosynthesis/export family protein [Polyangiales bacterium]
MDSPRPRPAAHVDAVAGAWSRWFCTTALTRCVSFAFIALALTACTATRVRVAEATPLPRFLELSKPYRDRAYRLAVGDLIATRCYFNPQLDEEVQVRPDGSISLSLIGEIKVAGKTAQELSAEITKAYSAYFLKSTAVVIVRQFNGHRVFTAGELKLPGMFSLMTSARTVLESIAASGGATSEATLHKVVLIRRLPNQPQPLVAELDVARALSGDDPSQDVALMPGDYVYVPRSGMAELNLVMRQYLLNNLNVSTYAGIPINIQSLK